MGDGEHLAVLTDGTATIAGTSHRWSTLGLHRLGADCVAVCWLLAPDQAEFDAVWAARAR